MVSWQWILSAFVYLSVSFPTCNFSFFFNGHGILAWQVSCSFQSPKYVFYCLLASMIFLLKSVFIHIFPPKVTFFSSSWSKYFLFIFAFQQFESYGPRWCFLCFGFIELLEFLGWHVSLDVARSHALFLWMLLLVLLVFPDISYELVYETISPISCFAQVPCI